MKIVTNLTEKEKKKEKKKHPWGKRTKRKAKKSQKDMVLERAAHAHDILAARKCYGTIFPSQLKNSHPET